MCFTLTFSLSGYHLETTNKSVKFEILMHKKYIKIINALARERTSVKTHDTESDLLQVWKIYCWQVGVRIFFFSPEMLQTGAVKGLSIVLDLKVLSRLKRKWENERKTKIKTEHSIT